MGEIVNTVPAVDQMKNAKKVSFLGKKDAPLKILIVGNSITRHGPKADIGWPNDWGMAASALEKDYVHRLYTMLTESGKEVYMRIRQAADWERNFKDPACLSWFAEDKDFQADILLFRLGENVVSKDTPYLQDATREFVKYLCPEQGRVVFTTCFWKNSEQDDPIKAVADEFGCPCIDIACENDSMMALGQFEHSGVAVHPSDAGMEMIAKKIFPYI